MMLAAKLSWLLRSFERTAPEGDCNLRWKGEPKDLYDVQLLLTKTELRADIFRKSLMAIGREDKLDWNNLQAIFDVRRAQVTDADFPNWGQFRERHEQLITCGPVELLRTIAERLEPLLGDFYRREEMPFLLAINSNPLDESTFLIYADWLEERGEQRGLFLRLFTWLFFRAEQLPRKELGRARHDLQAALAAASVPWLLQLFGTTARFDEIKSRIDNQS